MWPRQILDLGKQFNLMIRLQNILKASLQDVLKTFWRRLEEDVLKTSWRCLEDVFARRLEDVFKTYGQDKYIGLDQDVFWRRKAKANILVLIKTSWRRLEDVFWRRKAKANIFVLIKTSSEDEDERRLQDVFKTSSARMYAGIILYFEL